VTSSWHAICVVETTSVRMLGAALSFEPDDCNWAHGGISVTQHSRPLPTEEIEYEQRSVLELIEGSSFNPGPSQAFAMRLLTISDFASPIVVVSNTTMPHDIGVVITVVVDRRRIVARNRGSVIGDRWRVVVRRRGIVIGIRGRWIITPATAPIVISPMVHRNNVDTPLRNACG
jgi:hypothetical protein